MSSGEYGQFTCGFCGKPHLWKPRSAGRNVRCQCGKVMVVPAQPPSRARARAADPTPARPTGRPMPRFLVPAGLVVLALALAITLFLRNSGGDAAIDPDLQADIAPRVVDDADGAKSKTPWVLQEIGRRNTRDALEYLKPGDRTIGALPPQQAVQLVQAFKDAGATEVLVDLPHTYRGYTLFVGLPADEMRRTALIDLYHKSCEQFDSEPEQIFARDKYLVMHLYAGLVDDTVPVNPDGSPATRPAELRPRGQQPRPQDQP